MVCASDYSDRAMQVWKRNRQNDKLALFQKRSYRMGGKRNDVVGPEDQLQMKLKGAAFDKGGRRR